MLTSRLHFLRSFTRIHRNYLLAHLFFTVCHIFNLAQLIPKDEGIMLPWSFSSPNEIIMHCLYFRTPQHETGQLIHTRPWVKTWDYQNKLAGLPSTECFCILSHNVGKWTRMLIGWGFEWSSVTCLKMILTLGGRNGNDGKSFRTVVKPVDFTTKYLPNSSVEYCRCISLFLGWEMLISITLTSLH